MFFLEEQLPTSTWCCVSGSLFEWDFTAQRKRSQHVQCHTMRIWSCASSKHWLQDVTCHVPRSTSSIPMPLLQVKIFKPTMYNVALSDGSVATVPIFDVKDTLLSFYNDPCRMRRENFAANYDPFTGQSTITNPPLDEIHTGTIWEAACRNIVAMTPIPFLWRWCAFMTKLTQIYMGC